MVGLTAPDGLKISRITSSLGDICRCFKLMARKIDTCGGPEANPVSSYDEIVQGPAVHGRGHPVGAARVLDVCSELTEC